MEFSEDFISAALETEITLRRQLLLRGYELGRGGRRLGPEEAVAFLDEHFSPVVDDVNESIYEERRELDFAGRSMFEALNAHFREQEQKFQTEVERLKQQVFDSAEQTKRAHAADGEQARQMLREAEAAMQKVKQVMSGWQSVRVSDLVAKMVAIPMFCLVRAPGGQNGVGFLQARPFWKRLFRRRAEAGGNRLVIRRSNGTSSVLPDEQIVEFWHVVFPSA